MNSYSVLLLKAVTEFRDYAASEKGKSWPADWFLEMEHLLAVAAAEDEDKDAERLMAAISYSITDSGPLDSSLSPSLSAAGNAAYKKKKRPNQSPETTTMAVTPAASHPSRQP